MDTALYLRKAQISDINILYDWVNDSEVRKNAFNSKLISYQEHVAWFYRMMADPNQMQYILVLGDDPVGQIRLMVNGDEAEIDYSISKTARGCGYGKDIIRLVKEATIADYPLVKRLVGKVKPTNVVSYRCFEKNGFKEKYQQLEYDFNLQENLEKQKNNFTHKD